MADGAHAADALIPCVMTNVYGSLDPTDPEGPDNPRPWPRHWWSLGGAGQRITNMTGFTSPQANQKIWNAALKPFDERKAAQLDPTQMALRRKQALVDNDGSLWGACPEFAQRYAESDNPNTANPPIDHFGMCRTLH